MEFFVRSVSVVAPGLDGWMQARAVLRGDSAYSPDQPRAFTPDILPANARRRITPTIHAALHAASQAASAIACNPEQMSLVFVSCYGDLEVTHRICSALSQDQKPVSPIDFHNSVHNAPAGYWAIACQSNSPSLSLSAGPEGFSAGLLEAGMQACLESAPVLLVSYDLPPPAFMAWPGHPTAAFSSAFVLEPEPHEDSLGKIQIEVCTRPPEHPSLPPELEEMYTDNPAARSLPLLAAIAGEQMTNCTLAHHSPEQSLSVIYSPC